MEHTNVIEKRVALYARVSTNDKGQDPEVQLRELREYARQQGWTIGQEYVDRGISGAKEKRPELDCLMADAKLGKFDVVAVWKFDRFARSVIHLHKALEAFKRLGISFVSKTESVDTTTPMGKMIFTVVGAMAEMERELIGERVKAGMKNAKAKGIAIGRPFVTVDDAHLVQLKSQGKSAREISRQLDVPLTTIRRRLEAQAA
jgi:DNA invertase Pin-like site-specific DNA recombinase